MLRFSAGCLTAVNRLSKSRPFQLNRADYSGGWGQTTTAVDTPNHDDYKNIIVSSPVTAVPCITHTHYGYRRRVRAMQRFSVLRGPV